MQALSNAVKLKLKENNENECYRSRSILSRFSNCLKENFQLPISSAVNLAEVTALSEPSEKKETFGGNPPSKATSLLTDYLTEISLDKISWHDKSDDCWIVLFDRIYDVTEFLREHPGGADVLLEYGGRDATIAFRGTGHSSQAWQILQTYLIGVLPENERMHIFVQCEMGINFQMRAVRSFGLTTAER